jgi:hypothetical protein
MKTLFGPRGKSGESTGITSSSVHGTSAAAAAAAPGVSVSGNESGAGTTASVNGTAGGGGPLGPLFKKLSTGRESGGMGGGPRSPGPSGTSSRRGSIQQILTRTLLRNPSEKQLRTDNNNSGAGAGAVGGVVASVGHMFGGLKQRSSGSSSDPQQELGAASAAVGAAGASAEVVSSVAVSESDVSFEGGEDEDDGDEDDDEDEQHQLQEEQEEEEEGSSQEGVSQTSVQNEDSKDSSVGAAGVKEDATVVAPFEMREPMENVIFDIELGVDVDTLRRVLFEDDAFNFSIYTKEKYTEVTMGDWTAPAGEKDSHRNISYVMPRRRIVPSTHANIKYIYVQSSRGQVRSEGVVVL